MILGKFKILGHSMEPYLKEGEQVFTVGFLGINPEDVVVFKYDNKILIKRVKKILGNQYFLEGDNPKDSLSIDSVSKQDILGKVIFKI
jgi:phage repressor protein C with HTH and peptisase S24 domain